MMASLCSLLCVWVLRVAELPKKAAGLLWELTAVQYPGKLEKKSAWPSDQSSWTLCFAKDNNWCDQITGSGRLWEKIDCYLSLLLIIALQMSAGHWNYTVLVMLWVGAATKEEEPIKQSAVWNSFQGRQYLPSDLEIFLNKLLFPIMNWKCSEDWYTQFCCDSPLEKIPEGTCTWEI